MSSRNVIVDLKAKTGQYQRAMNKATVSTGGLTKSLTNVGKMAAGGALAGIAIFGAAVAKVGFDAAKSFATFETSLSRIEGLVGVPTAELAAMTDELKILSVETARGPQELVEALFFITSAGLEGAEAMDALEVSARAATAGLGDTATIADVVTSAMNAYGDQIGSAAVATDVLVATVREGKAAAPELAASLGRVIPIASQMGVRFDQVGAAIAAMTRTGLDANEASTALRAILNSLLAPTTDAANALGEVGLSAAGLRTEIKDKGLFSALQTMTTAFEGQDDATVRVFGNVRALTGVMSLMGSNAAATEDIFESLATSTGALDTAFGAAADTGAFAFEQAGARIKVAMLEVGEQILPKLADAMDKIAPSLPGVVEGLGDLAIVMVDLATSVVPAFASALSNIDLYLLGIQVRMLDAKNVTENFLNITSLGLNKLAGVGDFYQETDAQQRKWLTTQIKVTNAMKDGTPPINVMYTALNELRSEGMLTEDRIAALQDRIKLGDDVWANNTTALLAEADAAGWTTLEMLELYRAIEQTHGAADAMPPPDNIADWRDRSGEAAANTGALGAAAETIITPMGTVAEILGVAASEARSLSSAMLELTNPVYAAQAAVARMETAKATMIKTNADVEATERDKAEAGFLYNKSVVEAQAAMDGLSGKNVEATLQTMQTTLGISREKAQEYLDLLNLLDGVTLEQFLQLTILEPVGAPMPGTQADRFRNVPIGFGDDFSQFKRARGGRVQAGVPYWVGEEGPEPFIPDQSGTILPNSVVNNSGGNRQTNLVVHGSDDPKRDGEALLLMAKVAGL